MEIRLVRSPSCQCVCESVLSTFEWLNQSLWNLVCTYHGTWAHLNGVFLKSLPSVCVSVSVIPLSLLGKCLVNTFPLQRIHARIEELLDKSFSVRFVSYKRRVSVFSVYPFIVARQRLGKIIPAVRKNCWSCRFLCGPCRIKRNQAISSSQNFLFLNVSQCGNYFAHLLYLRVPALPAMFVFLCTSAHALLCPYTSIRVVVTLHLSSCFAVLMLLCTSPRVCHVPALPPMLLFLCTSPHVVPHPFTSLQSLS
jgi:hypothetical protein